MPKSRKRKSVKRPQQYVPVQQIVTLIREDTEEPVHVAVKSNKMRVLHHRPTKK